MALNSIEPWKEHWIQATENLETANLQEALCEIIASTQAMNQDDVLKNPYVFVDRAEIYLRLKRYEEALNDLEFARDSQYLTKEEYIRVISLSLAIYTKLGMREKAHEAEEIFEKIYPCPLFEVSDKKVIVKNVPECEFSKKVLRYAVTDAFCEKEEDIKLIGNMLVAERTKMSCECHINKPNPQVSACKDWCTDVADGGQTFCTGAFSENKFCLASCQATIIALRKICNWCCDGGNFYKKCVKPFEDILSAMGGNCNPDMD